MNYNIIRYDILKPHQYKIITTAKTYKKALNMLKQYELNNDLYYIEYDIIKKNITLKNIIRYYKIAFYILTALIILTAFI